ncbi:hypothetical protein WR25_22593 [Diploscapter pachys]|uniref:Methyltransferase domain-containing protein n=1 Tax=Diploscapter pachys TaxID=2018661 RepID=A0A2A2KJQ2_9BILA|nr:hypothetical protein WR25_22593 [Diploscapter pachys]
MSSIEDIRSDLRERYLRFFATMVGKEATINMYEQVKVSGRLLGSQSSSDCLLFANLQTPIGTLPAAALRMKDVERQELLRVIEQFSWIADITMMDYFVDDVWKKLPSSWREFLKDMQPNDWSHLLSYDIAPLNRVLPLSLLCLLRFSRSHSLDRTPPQDPGQMIQRFPSTSIALELSDSFTSTPKSLQSRIKLKKQHEIDRILELIRVILQIAESRGNRIERIVDVGAGIGHLSRMIAFDEKARYLDDNMKRRVELNQPIRSVQFLKCNDNDAETIGSEENGSKTLLIGLHSCGDLSPTSIRNFLSSTSASALLLFGCCYHKLSPYKYGQNDQTTIQSDDPQNQAFSFLDT